MSCIFIIAAPVVASSWPILSASILAAAASLGYSQSQNLQKEADGAFRENERSVDMTMPNSRAVSDSLLRGESFSIAKDAMTAVFSVDGRGECQVHVSGKGCSERELQAAGTELMDRVRQQFAYSQIMAEMEQRGFTIAKQEVDEKKTIRITVRR